MPSAEKITQALGGRRELAPCSAHDDRTPRPTISGMAAELLALRKHKTNIHRFLKYLGLALESEVTEPDSLGPLLRRQIVKKAFCLLTESLAIFVLHELKH